MHLNPSWHLTQWQPAETIVKNITIKYTFPTDAWEPHLQSHLGTPHHLWGILRRKSRLSLRRSHLSNCCWLGWHKNVGQWDTWPSASKSEHRVTQLPIFLCDVAHTLPDKPCGTHLAKMSQGLNSVTKSLNCGAPLRDPESTASCF